MATPTNVAVSNLSDYWPTFSATRVADAGKSFSMQWQVATDSAFTNVIATIDNTTQGTTTATVTQQFSSANRATVIPAGTYYVRARALENGVTASAWSATATVTSTVAPPTFTAPNISPQGSVGTTAPALAVDFLGDQSMSNYKRKLIPVLQFAAAADFSGTTYTFDVGSTMKYADSPDRISFTGQATPMPTGTYYVRLRARDEAGAVSAWVNGAQVTLFAAPFASNLSPSGQTVPYAAAIQLSWTYNDQVVNSNQTAYRVKVYKAADSSVVLDTGMVTSPVKSHTFTPSSDLKGVGLSWTVQVWNTQGYSGADSANVTFTLAEPAALTITSPTGTNVTTGRPTFNWSVGGVNPLASWVLEVRRTSDNGLVWRTSGGVGDYPVTPTQNILSNGVQFIAILTVTSTVGEVTTATKTFTAVYTPPSAPPFTVSSTSFTDDGFVTISWPSATPAASFYGWNLYRRIAGMTTWTRIWATTDPTVRSYQDWQVSTGESYEYVVTQTALVVDQYQESSIGSIVLSVIPATNGYWLIDPDNNQNNLRLNVNSDSFQRDIEESLLNVIGRGRVKEYGTDWGIAGDLTARMRQRGATSARDQFDALVYLYRTRKTLVMRDPFGELVSVTLGSLSYSHVPGTGSNEMFDVQVHIDEVR